MKFLSGSIARSLEMSNLSAEENRILELGHYPLAVLNCFEKHGFGRAVQLEKRLCPELSERECILYVQAVIKQSKG